MNRVLIAVAGLVAFLSEASATWAFTTQPVNPDTMSNRLADPDELADKMSNGQSGGTTLGVPGGHMMLQFSALVVHPSQMNCRHPNWSGRPSPWLLDAHLCAI